MIHHGTSTFFTMSKNSNASKRGKNQKESRNRFSGLGEWPYMIPMIPFGLPYAGHSSPWLRAERDPEQSLDFNWGVVLLCRFEFPLL
jgi:hypothetical protein